MSIDHTALGIPADADIWRSSGDIHEGWRVTEIGVRLHNPPPRPWPWPYGILRRGDRVLNSVRELIERAAPLLHAHLLGQPVTCELRHKGEAPEAVTLLVGGAAACEQHVTGELEP